MQLVALITFVFNNMFAMQNGLGIVLAGGLGSLLYLQKKEKVQVEEQLTSELSSERSAVDELKQKVKPLFSACAIRKKRKKRKEKKRKEKKRKEKKRKGKKRKEKKRKEKTTPLGVSLARSLVIYQAAQCCAISLQCQCYNCQVFDSLFSSVNCGKDTV